MERAISIDSEKARYLSEVERNTYKVLKEGKIECWVGSECDIKIKRQPKFIVWRMTSKTARKHKTSSYCWKIKEEKGITFLSNCWTKLRIEHKSHKQMQGSEYLDRGRAGSY